MKFSMHSAVWTSLGDCMRSLILAGGRSSRMGTDKALLEIDGVPCINRVAMALAEAGLEPIRVAVASAEHIERYGERMDDSLQVEWVVDSFPRSGPIEAVLEALNDPLCGNTLQLAPVDVPWLESSLLSDLEREIGEEPLAIPFSDGRWHPLLALVRPEVAGLIGEDRRPLHVQMTEIRHSVVEAPPHVVRNVNRPTDLE